MNKRRRLAHKLTRSREGLSVSSRSIREVGPRIGADEAGAAGEDFGIGIRSRDIVSGGTQGGAVADDQIARRAVIHLDSGVVILSNMIAFDAVPAEREAFFPLPLGAHPSVGFEGFRRRRCELQTQTPGLIGTEPDIAIRQLSTGTCSWR